MIEFFDGNFVLQYERDSALPPRVYSKIAEELALSDKNTSGVKVVCEIGTGTGNSAIPILQRYPNLELFVGVEPALGQFHDFLKLAAYKFGKTKLIFPDSSTISNNALAYIEEQKQKSLAHTDKVTLTQAISRKLPFADETFDRVYCSESMHWFAFDTPKSTTPNFQLLVDSLSEINRVLKRDGRLFFDSNGYIFDFGDEEINGRKINDIHETKHPFRTRFKQAFFRVASKMGLNVQTPEEEPSSLHRMLNLEKIKTFIESSSLELLTKPDGKPYQMILLPYSLKTITTFIVTSAKMTYFTQPDLQELSDQEKDNLIARATRLALSEEPSTTEEYYETIVFFQAQKR